MSWVVLEDTVSVMYDLSEDVRPDTVDRPRPQSSAADLYGLIRFPMSLLWPAVASPVCQWLPLLAELGKGVQNGPF